MYKVKRRTHPVFIEEDDFLAPRPKRLRLRFILLLFFVLLSSWGWHSLRAEDLEEMDGGQLMSATGQDVFTKIDNKTHIEVSGMVAHIAIEQHFKNNSDKAVEGVYVFPLPDKAAVYRMRITIGERIIHGNVKEKAEAKAIYQKAKASGKKAALVKQYRPNLFKTKVANIPAGETVVVELDYIDPVVYQQGEFQLRVPLSIIPRYSPVVHQADDSLEIETLMMDHFGWSGIDFTHVPASNSNSELSVVLDAGLPLQSIDSDYHAIKVTNKKTFYTVTLDPNNTLLKNDFVLRWRPQTGQSPRAALFTQTVKGQDYLQMMLLPPQQTATESALPREVIYVIDTSGSMKGPSIIQARESLLMALNQLTDQDSFNILSFNNTTHNLFNSAVPATPNYLSQAKAYVQSLQAGGGTEMMPALQQALYNPSSAEHVRQIIFITDGAVSNEEKLFNAIYQQLGQSRLFTVGIGSAPNSYFMRKAAEFGRGSFTHIGDINEVQQRMSSLLQQINQPLIRDITIEWPVGNAVEYYPEKIPDLYAGDPLVINATIAKLTGLITVRGKQQGGRDWKKTLTLSGNNNHRGIATLWAREKIQHLLDQKIKGRPEQEVRESVLEVALDHQLMSPYTSFVAVEQDLPKAQKPDNPLRAIPIPKTATAATLSLLWGGGLLLLFGVLVISIRKEQNYELDK